MHSMRMKALLFFLACSAEAGSLTDIKHVVLFMQENRAFDHYFGTMAGVRGFADPNVQVNAGSNMADNFHQPTANLSSEADQLTPWPLNYLGGSYVNSTQCMTAGSNEWGAMHQVFNGGLVDGWATADTPWSMGYYTRDDIPTHFDVADGWTVGDMYQEALMADTDPNRVWWMSGTVNQPGAPSNPNGSGGDILDDNASNGCDTAPLTNCFPFTWQTVPEYWQNAGATWQLYQDPDNFEDNMLAYFQQYQAVADNATNPLTQYGNSYIGLSQFYADALGGTLPMISVIVGPQELAEHPPNRPVDGAWLINQVVNAVTQGASANNTALFISYDETGGWADHVTPFQAPQGTAGEWITDPYSSDGDQLPIGPGFRMPFFIISPWTRGGNVFVEHADHSSQIMFVEQWLEAQGYQNVQTSNLTPWRRQYMSNLVNAFDFDSPDYTLPEVNQAPTPANQTQPTPVQDGQLGAMSGNWIGPASCLSAYATPWPPVPFGSANAQQNVSALVETGFKQVRGSLTEGRFLTFETSSLALATDGTDMQLLCTATTPAHDDVRQQWILHVSPDQTNSSVTLQSAMTGAYIGPASSLTGSSSGAALFNITYTPNGSSYTLSRQEGTALVCGSTVTDAAQGDAFRAFSVN